MGIRDWGNKKDNQIQSNKIEGDWSFRKGNTHLTIRDFTDTGVSYGDLVDGTTPMKLYTFKMYKHDISTSGEAGRLGKEYEMVAFEAPASWDITAAINAGMLSTILTKTSAINMSYNNGRQIDVLGRFDPNSNFTPSNPGIQEYVDETYVPMLNSQLEHQKIVDEQRRQKENKPGFFVRAIDKLLDLFDTIKERRAAKNEMKLLAAAQEQLENQPPRLSREEQGLSSNEIRLECVNGFRIGNSQDKNVIAVDIIGEPKMMGNGIYLYTAKKQLTRTFDSASELTCIPNCQFSLPVPPEHFQDFLMGCENPNNEFAKANAEALMLLLNQNPLQERGLYIGGLFVGDDRNLHYSEYQHMQDSINHLNGKETSRIQEPDEHTMDQDR